MLLEVHALTKTYDERTALADVSFHLDPGERTVVLGHNGAGKSTLLELVATLREPTSGSVAVDGHGTTTSAPAARRLIGLAPQSNALDPTATPREVLRLQGIGLGLRRAAARQRCDELLERLGLAEHAGARISTRSGGTRRKVDLAVALVGHPRLLILDEPTTGLDPVARLEFHRLLLELSASGVALLVSTQDLAEAEALATRVLVLREGRVRAHDTPARLKEQVGERLLRLHGAPDYLAAALGQHLPVIPAEDGVHLPVSQEAASLATALRTLAEHAHLVADVHLAPPSLDDVFLALAVR